MVLKFNPLDFYSDNGFMLQEIVKINTYLWSDPKNFYFGKNLKGFQLIYQYQAIIKVLELIEAMQNFRMF